MNIREKLAISKKVLLEGVLETVTITVLGTAIIFHPVLTTDQIKSLIVLGVACWTSYKLGQHVTKREFVKRKKAYCSANYNKQIKK